MVDLGPLAHGDAAQRALELSPGVLEHVVALKPSRTLVGHEDAALAAVVDAVVAEHRVTPGLNKHPVLIVLVDVVALENAEPLVVHVHTG